jgi:hypothetical protein
MVLVAYDLDAMASAQERSVDLGRAGQDGHDDPPRRFCHGTA